MSDAHIAHGVGILGNGGFHGPVGIDHVGPGRGTSLVQSAFLEGFAGSAAVLAHVKRNGRVSPTHGFPVGDLTGKDIFELGFAQSGDRIFWIDGYRHAIDGKGKADQPVFLDFGLLERPARVADLGQALARFLHAHA